MKSNTNTNANRSAKLRLIFALVHDRDGARSLAKAMYEGCLRDFQGFFVAKKTGVKASPWGKLGRRFLAFFPLRRFSTQQNSEMRKSSIPPGDDTSDASSRVRIGGPDNRLSEMTRKVSDSDGRIRD